MSDNVELLRGMYADFNRGDIPAALAVMHQNVEWSISPEAGPAPGTYHGHDGVRDAVSSMLEVWEEYRNEPIEYLDEGEFVIVRIRSSATGRASRIGVDDEVAHLWRVREGKVVRFEGYVELQQAVKRARALRSGDGG